MGTELSQHGNQSILYATPTTEQAESFSREMQQETEFDVLTFNTVNEALKILQSSDDIACIVSDYDLPDIDGLAFLQAIRAQFADMPFILFTSEGNEAVASNAIASRVTDYLIKERFQDQWAELASLIQQAITYNQSQRSLAAPEVRGKVILEASPEPIAILQNDQFEYANSKALSLFEVETDEELTDTRVEDILADDYRTKTVSSIGTVQAGDILVDRLNASFLGQQGTETPVELTVVSIQWDGTPAILLIFRDIIERQEREIELRRQNKRLDEFAKVLSHDLRNPLNVAQGRTDLIAEECQSVNIQPVADALDRMENMIEDTLTLARKGNKVTEFESIGITDIVNECWSMVQTDEATVEIRDEFTFEGEFSRLQHILENLFRNAVQHGGDGVSVRIGALGDEGFYVEDDGPGIPAEMRETAFEPGESTAEEGTGFGLTIVRRIAEAHGWDVSVTESDSGGARFEFSGVGVEC